MSRLLLRIPMLLLSLGSLYLLGRLLWPWSSISDLPLNGATGYDPAVLLIFYTVMILWLGGNRHEEVKKSLAIATVLGLPAAGLLGGQVLYAAHLAESGSIPLLQTRLMMLGAAILWGIAAIFGARLATGGIGLLSSMWSAMVSGLVASTVILGAWTVNGPIQTAQDAWSQYQGLAVGNSSTQALVNMLNQVTFFLLIGPLAGCVVGLFFSATVPKKKL